MKAHLIQIWCCVVGLLFACGGHHEQGSTYIAAAFVIWALKGKA